MVVAALQVAHVEVQDWTGLTLDPPPELWSLVSRRGRVMREVHSEPVSLQIPTSRILLESRSRISTRVDISYVSGFILLISCSEAGPSTAAINDMDATGMGGVKDWFLGLLEQMSVVMIWGTNPPARELGGLDVDGGPEQRLCNVQCRVRPGWDSKKVGIGIKCKQTTVIIAHPRIKRGSRKIAKINAQKTIILCVASNTHYSTWEIKMFLKGFNVISKS